MPDNSLTFSMDGDITLKDFVHGVTVLQKLVAALSREIGATADIQWIIDELQVGSAIATVRGVSEETTTVERVVQAYATVGRSLQSDMAIPYSPTVVAQAYEIRKLLGDRVTSIRFVTANEESVIFSDKVSDVSGPFSSYGMVEGFVQTLTDRNGLRFIIYDSLNDRAVSCYATNEQYESLRDIWGRRVSVEGWLSRDASTGRPLSIREISDITVLSGHKAGSFRAARGVAPRAGSAPSPVEAIRRLRDV